MAEHDEAPPQTPLEKMMFGALQGDKRFNFALNGLEPEDIDRIIYAFLAVHVFGGNETPTPHVDEGFSAIRRLCEVHSIEPVFEERKYPALKRGKSSGHKIILLPDSGSDEQNEKKSLQIIKYFSALEASSITQTIIGLIENFDALDIIRYVEKYNTSLDSKELEAFKARMLARYEQDKKTLTGEG
jgi:hypothetical protein